MDSNKKKKIAIIISPLLLLLLGAVVLGLVFGLTKQPPVTIKKEKADVADIEKTELTINLDELGEDLTFNLDDYINLNQGYIYQSEYKFKVDPDNTDFAFTIFNEKETIDYTVKVNYDNFLFYISGENVIYVKKKSEVSLGNLYKNDIAKWRVAPEGDFADSKNFEEALDKGRLYGEVFYTVQVDLDNGSELTDYDLLENEKLSIETPEKEGHKFIHWTFNGKVFNLDTPITENGILKAQYKKMWGTSLDENHALLNYEEVEIFPKDLGKKTDELKEKKIILTDYFSLNEGFEFKDEKQIEIPVHYKITETTLSIIQDGKYYGDIKVKINYKDFMFFVDVEKTQVDKVDKTSLDKLQADPGYDWYLEMSATTPLTEEDLSDDLIVIYGVTRTRVLYFHHNDGTEETTAVDGEIDSLLKDYYITLDRYGYIHDGWTDEKGEFFSDNYKISGPMHLYARWTTKTPTINFDVNGGDELTPSYIKVEYDNEYELPIPNWDHHTFLGWYNENGIKVEDDICDFETDINLIARWEDILYTITLKLNGGTTSTQSPITKLYDEDITIVKPYRQGYNFIGWYLDEGLTEQYTVTTMPDTNPTIYAKWELGTYYINFNSRGGNEIDRMEYHFDDPIATLPEPERLGYTFEGWYLSSTLEDEFDLTNMPEKDVEVFAKWSLNTYQIGYDLEAGAVNSSENPTEYNVNTNNITLQNPTKEGYNFIKWINVDTEEEVKVIEKGSTGDLNLKAVFEIKTYQIKFLVDGKNHVEPYVVNHGDTLVKPEVPEKEGYTFNYWKDQTNNKYDFAEEVTSNVTLRASFSINSYTITYNSNGGTPISQITKEYNEVVVAPNTPLRKGYEFKGWHIESDFSDSKYEFGPMPAQDLVLHAKWDAIEYQIEYVVGLGENDPSNPEKYTIETPDIILAKATREAYDFVGWFTEANGAGVLIDKIDEGSTEAYTLYAHFIPTTYEIEYENVVGLNNPNPVEYTVETDTFSLTGVKKNGYTFIGWFENSEFEGEPVEQITLGSSGNLVLYAKYEIINYKINYYPEGTDHPNTYTSYTINSETIVLEDAVKPGYNFIGWFDQEVGGNQITEIAQGSYKDYNLYARFSETDLRIQYFDTKGFEHDNPTQFTVESETITLNPIVKEGYIFHGWYLDQEHTGDKVIEIPAGTTKNVVLYAWLETIEYTITYNLNEGSHTQEQTTTYTVETESFEIYDAEKLGYNFKGWLNEENEVVEAVAKGSTGDIVLQANFEIINYGITYHLNGGRETTSLTKYYNVEMLPFTLEETVSKDYYNFDGWYETQEFTGDVVTEILSNTTGEMTFYAKWSPRQYTIEYNLDGGSHTQEQVTEFNVETPEFEIHNAEKRGYRFDGWYSDSLFTNKVTKYPQGTTGNKHLYAKFTIESYDIIYYNVTGLVNNNPRDYTVIDTYTLEDVDKRGYQFDGWYYNSEFEGDKIEIIGPDQIGEVNLYAKFTAIKYSIEYDASGGTHDNTIKSYTVEDADIILEPATKEGYTFDAWYTEPNGSGYKIDKIKSGSVGKIKLYAHFIIKKYEVKFLNKDGIQIGDTQIVEHGSSASEPQIPEVPGYENGRWDTDFIRVEGPLEVQAIYDPIEYELTYHVPEGVEAPDPVQYTIETETFEMPEVDRDYYEFKGWYTEENGAGDKYSEVTIGTIELTNLYAHFTPIEYKINYVIPEGATNNNQTLYTYESPRIELLDPIYEEKYKFEGWFTEANGEGTQYESIEARSSEDITLYAHFTVKEYTVRFFGKDQIEIGTAQIIEHGLDAVAPQEPEVRGYNFTSWDKEFTNVKSNLNVYAQYEITKYTLTYNVPEGVEAPAQVQYTIETETFETPEITRKGYTFDGWFTEENGAGDKYSEVTIGTIELTNLYAHFTPIEYEIEYNADGGTHANTRTKYTIEEEADIVFEPATKSGYDFAGWYIVTGSSEILKEKIEKGSTGNVSVVARYTIINYTITYELDGGSANETLKGTYNINTPTFILSRNVEKQHYDFDNWYQVVDGVEQVVTTIEQGSTGNVSVKAKWNLHQYKITYNLSEGETHESLPVVEEFNIDDSNITLGKAQKENYQFVGWFDQQTGGNKVETIITSEGRDRALYARFELNKYEIKFLDQDLTTTYEQRLDVEHGSLINAPLQGPEKIGHTFKHWALEGEEAAYDFAATPIENNTTFIPIYEINQYTITFNTDGGTQVSSITQDYGTQITSSLEPTKEGHTFVKWEPAIPETMPAKDMTIKAIWDINKYTVTFISDGVEYHLVENVEWNTNITLPSEPELTGYTFKEWRKGSVTGEAFNVAEKIKSDLRLHAYFIANLYQITYNTDGGSEIAPQQVRYKEAIPQVEEPTKTGYDFAGWEPEVPSTMPLNGITVKAKWTAKEYTITYHPGNGTILEGNEQAVTYNEEYTLREPVLEHFDFVSWHIGSAEGEVFESGVWTIDKPVDLYAKYEPIEYYVLFDLDGGRWQEGTTNVNTTTNQIVGEFSQPISEPSLIPVKTGYEFVRWATEPNGDVVFDFGQGMPHTNPTVYAVWELNSVIIEFNSNGGTRVDAITADFGTQINPPEQPTRNGYTFNNWYDNEQLDGEPYEFTTMPAETITLYAKWDIITYELEYKVPEDVVAPASVRYTVETETFETPTNLDKPYYDFAGWYDNPEFTGEPVAEITKGTYDLTKLHAHFTLTNYDIHYDLDGGDNNSANPETYTYEDQVQLLAPAKNHYEFDGWYNNSEFTGEKITEIPLHSSETKDVYAKWTPTKYTITYNLDGGVNGDNPATYTIEDESITLKKATKPGYTFKGWFKEANGQGIKVETINNVNDGNIELYAYFTINQYTITFNIDGGNEIDSITQDYGTQITPPAQPTKEGYTFVGWDQEIPTTMPAENITITATWQVNKYTITFNTGGGTAIDPITQDYGTQITPPLEPTKDGHTFVKWEPAVPETMPAENMTITATWQVNQYTITFDSEGGSAVAKIEADYQATIEAPAVPTKEGHTFEGWFHKVDGVETEFVFNTMPLGGASLYAKWDVNKYTITYEVNGKVYETQTHDYGTAITIMNNPEKAGYKFSGWTPSELSATMPAENKTVKGSFEIITYTITYNLPAGATHVGTPVEQYNVETAVTLGDAEQEGYNFLGWYDQEIEGTKVEVIAKGSTENKQLYAKFEAINYNIKYNLNGGTETNPLTGTYTINDAVILQQEDVTRAHYEFAGWFDNVEFTGNPVTEIPAGETGNKEFWAKWTPKKYSITYLPKDANHSNVSKYDIETAVTLTDASKLGYEFKGWYTEANGQGINISGFAVGTTGNQILHAHLVPKVYNIAYNLDEGINGDNPETYTVEDSVITLQPASKEGYTFQRWEDATTNEEVTSIDPSGLTDITLNAIFKVNQYTITFDSKGGSAVADMDADYQATIEAPAVPTKEGHTFEGWFSDVDGVETEFVFDTMPLGGAELYAKWTVNSYTITFDTDGGTAIDPITKDYGTQITPPLEPTKDGHTFVKWEPAVPETMPAENMTITATWQVNEYTITFETGEGTPVAPITKDYGTLIDAPANPERTGYEFTGWTPELPAHMPAENITLVANWQVNKYTITFNTGGGTAIDPITQDYGTQITPPLEPTKDGHTFVKWEPAVPETMPAENMTITATWKINTYEINFNVESIAYDTQTIEWNKTANKPEVDPTKEGYTFLHWSKEENGTAYNFGDRVREAFDLYAVFEINEHTITFDTDGGTLIDPITQDYGTQITPPLEPTKDGHTFVKWEPAIPETMPAENITLVANWQVNKYTITFNTGGGTAIDPITQDYGTQITPPLEPTKEGHTFEGWFHEVDGVETEFVFDTMPLDGANLYAKWKVKQYKIIYKVDNVIYETQTYDYGTVITIADNPTKEGYTFSGWTPAELPETMPAEDIEVTGTFTVNQYTITFETGEGTPVAPITKDYGTLIDAPANPVREGYKFTGWTPELPAHMPAEDMTLVANWKIKQYTITFDTDGGTQVPQIKQDYGTQIAEPVVPTKDGYTFVKWEPAIPETMPAENMTITATWKINTYEINFNVESIVSETQTIEWNKTANKPEVDPTKEGYTFLHWSKEENGTAYNFGDRVREAFDLYAVFEINEYTITFDTDGGTQVPQIKQDYGTQITPPLEPTKDGHTFVKWEPAVPETMPAENITITATWQVNSYTITYKVDGEDYLTETYDYGTAVTIAAVPTKVGYRFSGWNPNKLPATMPAENIEVIGSFELETYSINYMLNEGAHVGTPTIKYNIKTEVALGEAERTGYTFEGWFDNAEFTGEPVTKIPVGETGNKKFWARWDVIKYSITYLPEDAVHSNVLEYDITEEVILTDASKPGYEFKGWYTEANGQGINITKFDVGTTGNKKLYAHLVKETYTITYKLDGGSHTGNRTTYQVDTPTFTLNEATKNGYTSLGWFTSQEGGELVTEIPVNSTGNITLYARYQIDTYTITYILNDGTNNPSNPGEYTVETENITLLDPTKDNYEFVGWYTDKTFAEGTQVETLVQGLTGNKTLYARWTPKKYEIKYNLDGGTNDVRNPSQYTYGVGILRFENATKANHQFVGWFDQQTGGNQVTSISETASGTKELYARFEINKYQVRFLDKEGAVIKTEEVAHGSSATAPIHPEITGYEPNGWDKAFDNVTSQLDVQAQYKLKTYTITYIGADGLTNAHPSEYTIETPTFNISDVGKDFYTFEGWFNEETGGNQVTQIVKGSTGDITLYARWEAIVYNIKYVLNNGAHVGEPHTTYTYEDKVTLTQAEKANHQFIGWYDNLDFNGEPVTEIPINSNGHKTFYAKFEINKYTVTFEAKDGSVLKTQVINHGSGATAPQIPNITGYKNGRWDKDFSNVTQNLVVKATYDLVEYTITYEFTKEGVENTNPTTYTIETPTINLVDATLYGHHFEGWFKEATYETSVESIPEGSTGNKTLYGKLVENEHNLILLNEDGTEFARHTRKYGKPISIPTDPSSTPTKLGHSFDAWLENGSPVSTTVMPDNDVTLQASFVANQYTITFNLDGGTPAISDLEVTYDAPIAGFPANPQKDEMIFAGWYLGEEVFNPEGLYQYARDIELKAKWEAPKAPILTVTNSADNITYGDSPFTLTANMEKAANTASHGDLTITGYSWIIVNKEGGVIGTEQTLTQNVDRVGTITYEVTVTYGYTNVPNFEKSISEQVQVVISKKSITASQTGTLTYTSSGLVPEFESSGIISGDDVQIELVPGQEIIDAGEHNVNVQLTGTDANNYSVINPVSITVNKADAEMFGNVSPTVDSYVTVELNYTDNLIKDFDTAIVTSELDIKLNSVSFEFDFTYSTVASLDTSKGGSTFIIEVVATSTSGNFNPITQNVIVKLKTVYIGENSYTIEDALDVLSSNQVAMIKYYTSFSENSVQTIVYGTNTFDVLADSRLVLPMDDNYSSGADRGKDQDFGTLPARGDAFSRLYVTPETTVNVSGHFLVNAYRYNHGTPVNGTIGGTKYAILTIEENAVVNIMSGGFLQVQGMSNGDGLIDVKSGGEAMDFLTIFDYRGGNASYGAINYSRGKGFPFNYYAPFAIQNKLKLISTSKYTMAGFVTANAEKEWQEPNLHASSNALFELESGTVYKYVSPQGQVVFDFDNAVADLNIKIEMKVYIKINFNGRDIPLGGFYKFNLCNGSIIDINASVLLLSGSEIYIDGTSTINIREKMFVSGQGEFVDSDGKRPESDVTNDRAINHLRRILVNGSQVIFDRDAASKMIVEPGHTINVIRRKATLFKDAGGKISGTLTPGQTYNFVGLVDDDQLFATFRFINNLGSIFAASTTEVTYRLKNADGTSYQR